MNKLALIFLIGISSTTGCAGQIKAAALEHASASKTIAATLTKATALIKCTAVQPDATDTCTAAVVTINDQAKALQQSADRLAQGLQ